MPRGTRHSHRGSGSQPFSQSATRTRRRVVPDTALQRGARAPSPAAQRLRRRKAIAAIDARIDSRKSQPGPLSQRPDAGTTHPAGQATRVHPLLWPGLTVSLIAVEVTAGAVLLSAPVSSSWRSGSVTTASAWCGLTRRARPGPHRPSGGGITSRTGAPRWPVIQITSR